MTLRQTVVAGSLLSLFSSIALASPITYTITANTSSLAGTTGSLDFNFNPGPMVSQAASVQILNFASSGVPTGSPVRSGDVTGMLPGTLTFDNATSFNDYFQTFRFGPALTFQVSLFGPALSAPDGRSSSGSTFAFSIFSDAAGTIPALTTDTTNGFAYLVNVNLDGSTTATNFLPSKASAAPEPDSWIMVAGAAALLLGWSRAVRMTRYSA